MSTAQPCGAWAGDSYEKCGPGLSTSAGGDPLELTITGTGDMYKWTGNNSSLESRPWHSFRAEIYSVVVSSGATGIGAYAFHGFDSLTMVAIPKSVHSVGEYAFAGCSKLKAVVWDGTLAEWKSFLDSVPADGNSALKSANLRV